MRCRERRQAKSGWLLRGVFCPSTSIHAEVSHRPKLCHPACPGVPWDRSGGICSSTFGYKRMCHERIAPGLRFSIKAHCRSLRCATPDFLSNLVALMNVVRLYIKPHTWPWAVTGSAPVPRHAGAGGMTKLRAVANLGSSGGGWTESKKLIRTSLDFFDVFQVWCPESWPAKS